MGTLGWVAVGGGIVIGVVVILWYFFWPKTRGKNKAGDNDLGQCIANGHITEHVSLAQCKAMGGGMFTPDDIEMAQVKLPGSTNLP